MIVRDEIVYEAKNYGKTKYIATEGQFVHVGDPIIEVYAWGYNDETLSKLLELQKLSSSTRLKSGVRASSMRN